MSRALASRPSLSLKFCVVFSELNGELIRWNLWHSWDLNAKYDPRDISNYPKPAKYDPLNPPRPNIRAKRLARELAK